MQKNLKLISWALGFCCSLFCIEMKAQKKLAGRVTDERKENIFAANIYLKSNPLVGTTSGSDGTFLLSVEDRYLSDTLVVSYMGYYPAYLSIRSIDFSTSLTVCLRVQSTELAEWVVEYNPSLTKEFSIKELDRLSIYMLPVSQGDPLKAITFLPASTNTSENANPELRGSASDFSRVVLNNVPVYQPVRNSQLNGMGNFSILNTELVGEQEVYASNPPLKFGNSTAGLVEIKTINRMEKKKELKVAASLANAALFYSQAFHEHTFFQVYGNLQYSKPYLKLNGKNASSVRNFCSTDAGLNLHHDFSKQLGINIYAYFLKEKYNANSCLYAYEGNMYADRKRNFNIVNLEYKRDKVVISLNNGTNFSASDYAFGNIASRQHEKQVYSSVDAKMFWAANFFSQAGFSYDYADVDFDNVLPTAFYAVSLADSTYHFTHEAHNHNLEFYLYSKYIFSNLILGGAIRKNLPVEGQKGYWSYQFNGRYNLHPSHALLLSYGQYNGYTVPAYSIQKFLHVNSRQFSLEYMARLDHSEWGVAFYSKRENNPVFYTEKGYALPTRLKIRGIEVSGEYILDQFRFSGSFTWLDSEFNNGDGWFRSYNDINYLLKLGVDYTSLRWVNAAVNYSVHPGLYYTPIVSSVQEDEGYRPLFGSYNSARYNRYSTLDLTINKLFSIRKVHFIVFLTLSNVLNRSNYEKIKYNSDYSEGGHWLYQKRLWYFGLQMTI